MEEFLEKIRKKIVNEINPENILLVDKSHLHSKHKSFSAEKYYLKLVLNSNKLKNMNKIKAHKLIFSILEDEIKNKIHALEIEIK